MKKKIITILTLALVISGFVTMDLNVFAAKDEVEPRIYIENVVTSYTTVTQKDTATGLTFTYRINEKTKELKFVNGYKSSKTCTERRPSLVEAVLGYVGFEDCTITYTTY